MPAPNLLFLMTDHQRADSLGMVQAGVEVTPHQYRLAARGATFTRAYNACPLCVPALTLPEPSPYSVATARVAAGASGWAFHHMPTALSPYPSCEGV